MYSQHPKPPAIIEDTAYLYAAGAEDGDAIAFLDVSDLPGGSTS